MVMITSEEQTKTIIPDLESDKPSLKNLLKNKSYVLLFSGQLLNMIASMLAGMTFSYLIYETTQNAALMALMGILGSLPTVLLVTFAGVIVDRFDQRKLIFITTILRSVMFVAFLIVFVFINQLIVVEVTYVQLTETITQRVITTNYIHFIWPMYLLLFINNVVFTLYNLTASTYSKFIIKKKNLLVANSFNSTVNQVSSVIGPILAGMIITISYLLSYVVTIGIASLGSVVCLFLMFKGKQPPVIKMEKSSFKGEVKRVVDDMKVGFDTIRSIPKVLYVTIVYMFFNLGTSFINGMFAVVLQGEMNLNATWYGAVIAVMSGIGVLTSLIILKLGKIDRKLIIINLVILAEAVGLFLFAFIRNPWIMMFIITIPFGFVNGGANIPSFTLRQEKIPHEKLGRATSFGFMFCNLFNLTGMVIVMLIANRIDASYIVLIGAIICSVLSLVAFTTFMTKSQLRCSDYHKDEVIEKETKVVLESFEDIDSSKTSSSTVSTTTSSPSLE